MEFDASKLRQQASEMAAAERQQHRDFQIAVANEHAAFARAIMDGMAHVFNAAIQGDQVSRITAEVMLSAMDRYRLTRGVAIIAPDPNKSPTQQ